MLKNILLLSFLLSFNAIAYELPKVNLTNNTKKPEIIMFDAESFVKDNQAFYRLKWKTINATDVIMTYIGRVALFGTLDITKEEYNRGAITLTATKQESNVSDSKTINKQSNVPQEAPIIFKSPEKPNGTMKAYRSMPLYEQRQMRYNYLKRRGY